MPQPTTNPTDDQHASASSHEILGGFISPPENPLSINTLDDPDVLQAHLDDLRSTRIPLEQYLSELEKLFISSMAAVDKRLSILTYASLPIHRKDRQLVRSLQKLLDSLATDLQTMLVDPITSRFRNQNRFHDITLGQILQLLSRHLLISYLSAAPAGIGIWQRLHRAYAMSQAQDITQETLKDSQTRLQSVYYAAVLLGCSQPASFSSPEISFVTDYLELFSDQIDPGNEFFLDSPAAFWIDMTRDAPATPCSRKSAPPDTVIHYFCCDRIAVLLKNQLESLETGVMPAQLGLPDLAGTATGRGVMRRLMIRWGEPGKRRFPRRRQNYRATLCTGLGNLWKMLHTDDPTGIDVSTWMIVNESPDGYAVMHVSGKPGVIVVGDVTAIRTETGNSWQVCIVRWALSENQEHLELGLQIIATRAVPALLATPKNHGEWNHLPVLLLPEVPPLRPSEMLVAPSGTIGNYPDVLVLMVEKENLEIREMYSTGLREQNSQVEILTVESGSMLA